MLHRICILSLLLFSAFLVVSCDRDEDFYTIGHADGPTVSGIIRFQNISAPAIADNYTPVLLKIQIDPQAAGSKKDIRIATSLGSFANNDTAITVGAGSNGEVTVPFKSAKAGLASIRATINNVRIDTSLTFTAAFPQDMILSSDKYVLDTVQNTSAIITAKLFRDQGAVSDPIKVHFTVNPDLPSTHPMLIEPFVFSENKEAKANLQNPFLTKGWLTITAFTVQQPGDTLKKSIRIKVE